MIREIIDDLAALFFPPHCAVCGEPLTRGEHSVCTLCRTMAPLTDYARRLENPVWQRCRAQVAVERASGFLFYVRGSGWRELVHSFKYRGRWRLARDMGRWYGATLRASGLYADIDLVVPLPLHPFKRMRRGYNQSEYIAEGIAEELGVRVERRAVFRRRNTASQTLLPRHERAQNVADAFAVRHTERLAGHHILLVDDVMTTGSTLLSCAAEIIRRVPDCRISIAALAVLRHELGVKD